MAEQGRSGIKNEGVILRGSHVCSLSTPDTVSDCFLAFFSLVFAIPVSPTSLSSAAQ